MNNVITVDGPSGAGKGTISQSLAQQLNWHYLDSGALYRLLAFAALEEKVDLHDEVAILALLQKLDIQFEAGAKLNGLNVEQHIRSESMGNNASKVAQHPRVRLALLDFQRGFAKAPGLVADGRDMGTTVFPKSPLKIYLTASVEERARRRANQMQDMGLSTADQDGNIAALCCALGREIAERDARDANRSESPSRPADDAILIDTSKLSVDQILAQIENHISKASLHLA